MRKPSDKKPKLIAVDLDGTLLDTMGNPHEADVRALRAVRSLGVVVTIVTGRLYSGTRRAAEALGLAGPVGCVDGSHVVSSATHKTLYHRGFERRHAEHLRRSFETSGPATFLFADDTIVHDQDGVPFLDYVSTWSTSVTRTERVVEHPLWEHEAGITAIVAVGTAGQILDAAKQVDTSLGTHAQIATFPTRPVGGAAGRWGMVVRASGGNKGSALEWIARHHGLELDETVAVGDWMNDVPMLKVAGRSFAMGQAPDEVKAHATDTLEETAQEGGGVASAVAAAFGVRVP